MKNAIGYIRVSTVGQAEDDKYGVDVQRSEIEKYAAANGYSIIDWKIDTASGASEDRPALNEILYGGVSNPPYEAVIVFKNDRLARDTKLYFYYLYTLEKKSIKLLSVCEEFVEGNEFANIYRALLQFVAEQERKNITLRTSNGRELKASMGGYSGGRPPYGYKAINKKLVIDPYEAEIVRYMFKKRKQGWPIQAIVDGLNEAGYRNRSGRTFTLGGVATTMKNENLYRGLYKYGTNEWVQGVHEPILKG